MTDLSTSACADDSALPVIEPSDLAVALRVAHRMLAHYGDPAGYDIYAYAQAHGGLTEALRILLRALDAEPQPPTPAAPAQPVPLLQKLNDLTAAIDADLRKGVHE